MKRPMDSEFRNNPSGTLTYLFELEKYCDHIEQKNKELMQFLTEAVWHGADKRTKEGLTVFIRKINAIKAEEFDKALTDHLKTNKE